MDKINTYANTYWNDIVAFAPQFLGAALVFIIGRIVVNWLSKMVTLSLKSQHLNISVQTFFASIITIGLKILLVITVAGMLGIQTTSFVAIIGALSLAVGLALQGSLANFAGGVLILIFKPFKVGDHIESQGQSGLVIEIQIFNTLLLTPDNKTVILANGAVSNNTVVNLSRHGALRADIMLTVDSSNDIDFLRKIIIEAAFSHPDVLPKPAPEVHISKITDDNMVLAICPYTDAMNYWSVYHGVQEAVKNTFAQHHIKLPKQHFHITQIPA